MRATLVVLLVLLLAAPVAMAAGTATQTTPQLSPSVPWLTTTTPVPTSTKPAVDPSGNLPFTGDDLLPESLVAVLLISAGIVVRLRSRPRW